jgi:hypothetical protein
MRTDYNRSAADGPSRDLDGAVHRADQSGIRRTLSPGGDMNFLQYLFGGRRGTFEPEAVRVFLTRTAKWRALCGAVRAAQDAGERVLIVAHFPATLREAGAHLGSAGFATSIRDRPLTSHETAERTEPPSVLLVPVPALVASDEPLAADATDVGPLSIYIPEMHPLRAAEDAVDAFAAAIPVRVRMYSYVSLEDPLIERMCGPWMRDVLRKLGMQEQEEIQSALVERQIRQAQAKVSRQVESFEPADSAEEWVQRNLPPKN